MSYRTRFAPSPTGLLHLGHAYSALIAFEAARANAGDLILRIEDIDHMRCRPHYEYAIYDDLAWLGIDWETPVLRQSEHLRDYAAALDTLRGLGVLYADHKTRKGEAESCLSAPQDIDNTRLDELANPAWRLSLSAAKAYLAQRYDTMSFVESGQIVRADPNVNGDVILGRKDIGVAYHLCVVIDDARQGVTHIHRGHDLYDATHTQVLLQTLLNLPTPAYTHHPLLLDDQNRRLAKRKGSRTLSDYRADGLSPSDIKTLIACTPKA